LYKFTSFFSYIYNFVRFCGKLFNGGYYVYDQIKIYIRKRRGYTNLGLDDIEAQDREYLLPNQNTQQKTLFQTCKDYLTKKYDYYYFRIFGKRRNTFTQTPVNNVNIQLTETSFTNSQSYSQEKQYERNLFDKQMNELCENNSSIEFNDYVEQHKQLRKSMEKSDDNMFRSVELHNDRENSFTSYLFGSSKNKPYGVSDSDLLFDSGFITQQANRQQTPQQQESQLKNQSIQTDPLYPPNLKIQDDFNPNHTHKRKIDTIMEEDENKIVFRVNSLWNEPKPNENESNGVSYSNKKISRETSDNISKSFVDDKSNLVDYEYKNEILKNPYI
jgi:hypothetical protein